MRCIACGKRLIIGKKQIFCTENAGYLCDTCDIAYNMGVKNGMERGKMMYADKVYSSDVSKAYSELNERLGRIEDHVNVLYVRDRSRKRRDW